MYSYTKILWSPSEQYPIKLTRFGWWRRLNIRTSQRNSLLPCIPFLSNCLTATTWLKRWIRKQNQYIYNGFVFKEWEVEGECGTWFVFSRDPLYTLPKPPSPSRDSFLKLFVAAARSWNVKVRALMLFPPLLIRFNSLAIASCLAASAPMMCVCVRMDCSWCLSCGC